MTTDMTTTTPQLPANIQDMVAGYARASQEIDTSSVQFLKMDKDTGEWFYGADETTIGDGSLWAINPTSFQHGWIAWGDGMHGNQGRNLGERMVSATKPLPLKADLPEVEGSWSLQVGFDMLCVDGEDEGVRVRYLTNSYGGKKLFKTVLDALVAQISSGADSSGTENYVPIVVLGSSSYDHKKFRRVINPQADIKRWESMSALASKVEMSNATTSNAVDGPDAPVQEVLDIDDEPVVEEAASRRRRRKKA